MGGHGGSGPLVSVIVAAHNAEKLIERALESVSIQSNGAARVELVVVDDGSTDGTAEVVSSRVPAVALVTRARGGPGAARNHGARAANGDYLAFLDADDELHPEWLETMASALGTAPVACCGMRRAFLGRGREVEQLPRPLGPAFYDYTGWFDSGTYLIQARLFEAIGGFSEDIRYGEHDELAMRLTRRLAAEGARISSVARPLVLSHHDRGPLKHSSYASHKAEGGVDRILERHGDRMREDPALLADYLAVAGVALVQAGRLPEARRSFASALGVGRRPKDVARLGLSLVPTLARRVWARFSYRPVARRTDIWVGPRKGTGATRGVPKKVSVIMPALNAAATIADQLEALSRQDYGGAWEVLVSDNGSTDGTREIAEQWASRLPLRVVDSAVQRGYAYAVNHAAWAADGDFLVFCDADDVVTPGWLSSFASAAPSGDILGGWCNAEPLNGRVVRSWRPNPPSDRPLDAGGIGPLVPSGNMGVWASTFRELGGFREDLGSTQDFDLSLRAALGGYRVEFVPGAELHYRYRETLRDFARQTFQYAFHGERVRLEFGAYLPADRVSVARSMGWLVLRLPYLVISGRRRGLWVRVAARLAGRALGRAWWGVMGLKESNPGRLGAPGVPATTPVSDRPSSG